MSDIFTAVKECVSMVEVVSRYRLEINRAGFAVCPFHSEKTASLRVYENSFYCFGCGAGGDTVAFVSALRGLSQIEAAKELNEAYRLGLFEDTPKNRRQLKVEIAERERERKITEALNSWYDSAFKIAAELNSHLRAGVCSPTINTIDSETKAVVLSVAEYWNCYLFDIFNSARTTAERLTLLKEYSEFIRKIEYIVGEIELRIEAHKNRQKKKTVVETA